MRSLRPEHILLLAFVVVPLINLLVRWFKGRAREGPRHRPAEPAMAEPVEREGWRPAALPPRVRVIAPAPSQEAPRHETRRTTPPPRPGRRRAARLGGRAAVRRAIVAMAILGPCRALEEPLPSQPVGSLQQGARRP